MNDEKFETTDRGFKIYGKFIDRYDSEVTVQESSIVGRPCAWVFATNDPKVHENPHPHLAVEDAKKLISALQNFVDDAESENNWRNDPEYKKSWG